MTKGFRARNKGPRRILPWSFVLSLAVLLFPFALAAAPVSATSARIAAEHWLQRKTAAHMKARMNRAPKSVRTVRADGEDAFHVVTLEGGGFVVVSADDRVEPVIAFTDSGTLDEDPENPLWALLNRDVPERLREHRRGTVRRRNRRAWRAPDEEWRDLLSAEATAENPQANGQPSVADVRVEPLVQSKWNQSNVSSKKCYNYYTPNGYVCGCVATAGAQLMRYHRFPTTSVSPVSRNCWVDKTESRQTMMGGVYDWGAMPLVPNSSTTEAQRQAIGKLCYDVGVATRMSWTSSASGACPAVLAEAYTEIFGYANSKCQLSSVSDAVIEKTIFANLDAKCPVLLGISGDGGHEIVADGYGCYEGSIYTHLNLGWGGSNDAWYLLPSVSTSSYDFDSVNSIVYNVFPTESAELLTGRVTDNSGRPVVGVTVTGTKDGEVRSAETDEHGIYALKVAKGSWKVAVSTPGGVKQLDGAVSIDASRSTTLSGVTVGSYSYIPGTGKVGNSWGNDIVLPDYEAPKLLSVAISGPSKVMVGKDATYVCIGRFDDGDVRPLATASWTLSDNTTKSKKEWWDIFGLNVKTTTYATMDSPGVLTAKKSGKTVTITVTGTENEISHSATLGVEIVDNDPTQVVPTLADLRKEFGSESEIVRRIVDETELKAFNGFLVQCGIWSTDDLSEGRKRWAYRSFVLSRIAVSPELYEAEPKLSIVEALASPDGLFSFSVSLTAGEREIALSRKAIASCIRVGAELDQIDCIPDGVIEPSADGTRLTFVIRQPQESAGFIRLLVE